MKYHGKYSGAPENRTPLKPDFAVNRTAVSVPIFLLYKVIISYPSKPEPLNSGYRTIFCVPNYYFPLKNTSRTGL